MAERIRVLLTGGGTGGHVYPAVVVANEVKLLQADAELLFVGTRRGLESTVVPRLGYNIKFVDVSFLVRKLTFRNFVTLYKAIKSVFEAKKIIKEFKPHVVVGTGGYVSGPVVLAATMAKVPTLVHEQNAFPGLTTRLLASRVTRVAVSHAEAVKRLKSGTRTVVTGHPVRREFYEIQRSQARDKMDLGPENKLILVVGGSGGAKKINQVILQSAPRILADSNTILMHITGKRYLTWVQEEKEKMQLPQDVAARYRVTDFVHDIPLAMAACDLIVARSGGMVHEMTVAGCPALLIPSPNVTDDHQLHNALAMAENGAALVIEEKDLTAEKFSKTITDLVSDSKRLEKMQELTKAIGKPQAGSNLAKIIFKMANIEVKTNGK